MIELLKWIAAIYAVGFVLLVLTAIVIWRLGAFQQKRRQVLPPNDQMDFEVMIAEWNEGDPLHEDDWLAWRSR